MILEYFILIQHKYEILMIQHQRNKINITSIEKRGRGVNSLEPYISKIWKFSDLPLLYFQSKFFYNLNLNIKRFCLYRERENEREIEREREREREREMCDMHTYKYQYQQYLYPKIPRLPIKIPIFIDFMLTVYMTDLHTYMYRGILSVDQII